MARRGREGGSAGYQSIAPNFGFNELAKAKTSSPNPVIFHVSIENTIELLKPKAD